MKLLSYPSLLLAAVGMLTACTNMQPQIRPAQPIETLSSSGASHQNVTNGIIASNAIQPASAEDLDESNTYRYRLTIGDKIDIKFYRRLEYSTEVTLANDGTISLPFLPAVVAEGKTIEELTDSLQQQYLNLSNNAPTPENKQYLISVGDTLDIKFPYVSEYSGVVKVRLDGRISLPLIGSVIAEGQQPEALQVQLQKLYKPHIENPVLVVSVLEAISDFVLSDGKMQRVSLPDMSSLYVSLRSAIAPKVYIGGEVQTPGAIGYEPTLTSLQAIIAAGGITSKSQLNNVIILRKSANNEPRYIVRNLAADISGQASASSDNRAVTNDLVLRPFDIIIVPKTGIAKVSDALNAYLFDLFPMIRNSSIGFNYQIGTMRINQKTNLIDLNTTP